MILLRLHQSISIILSLRIRHVLHILNYTFIAGIAGAVDTGFFYLFFQHWAVTLLQEKHKTWEREDNPVNDTSVMKNIPSSLRVIARILCLDVWLRGAEIQDRLLSSGRAETVELRCDCQVIQSKREKRKRRLTTCLIPDSCQIPLKNVQYCRILSTMFFAFFGKFSILFHIAFINAADLTVSHLTKEVTALACNSIEWCSSDWGDFHRLSW